MCGQVIYPAAVLKTSAHQAEAQAFLDYLSTPEAMEVFESGRLRARRVMLELKMPGRPAPPAAWTGGDGVDCTPLINSLRIAAISSVIVFFAGIFCSYYVAKLPRVLKGVLTSS